MSKTQDELLNDARIKLMVESRIKANEQILQAIADHIKLLTDTATAIIQYPDKVDIAGLIKYFAIADKYRFLPKKEMDKELKLKSK